MIKKCIILTQFGSPHEWTEQFLANVGTLGQYGYSWKIFTENEYQNVPENVEIVKMSAESFAAFTLIKLGVRPNMFMTEKGVPSVHVTDFYAFGGLIFEDWLHEYDYWGIANIDIVFGRLDHFLPDSELIKYDIWTDDTKSFNGIFTLLRNTARINRLCLEIPEWREKLTQAPCRKCLGISEPGEPHSLYGTDEYDMSRLIRRADIAPRVGRPKYYPIHGYDRLESQVPEVKLSMKDDGSLWELQEDVAPPVWEHAHRYFGREVAYYHFIVTKKWPNLYDLS